MLRKLKIAAVALPTLLIVAGFGAYMFARSAGHAQINGTMKLTGLTAPVTVLRDELGTPYIFAANTPDLIRAQGFVTTQNRLLQMELFRATWRGELAATFGPDALPSDIRMRVLGTRRNGERHAARLDPAARDLLQYYVDGINAYIANHVSDHPIELKLAGLAPRLWSVADLVTLVHFVHYTHSTNFKAEVVAQKLIDKLGGERAAQIMPLTINPDWSSQPVNAQRATPKPVGVAGLNVQWSDLTIAPDNLNHQGLGSNNWAVGPSRSKSGKAIVSNDPHLDNRILPGTWHPVGLFSPEVQAVGAAIPGLPGIMVGRTQHVAFGVTNAYGDVQDVYVETSDPANPANYMDGGRSVPFEVITENIQIKDKAAPGGVREQALKIRLTKRGPVISDHAGVGPTGDKLLVLRSTDAEVLGPVLGIEGLLTAPNAAAFDREVQKIDLMMFNFVFGDDQGNIAHRATGAVPIRSGADGGLPRLAPKDGKDDWTGFIPKDRMPGMVNPPRAWVGSANNDTRPQNFPWYYTNYVSPNYRYTRMGQVLGEAKAMTVDDHLALMRDNRNLQSDVLRGAIVAALKDDPAQRDLANLLEKWDGVDRADQAAPLVYQALYREIAIGTFLDELGPDALKDMLSTWYFWQQRFDAMVATPDSPWFDDVNTKDKRETLADVIRSAAPRARALIEAEQGKDTAKWRWGKSHTLRFVSPLRRNGSGQELLGGFTLERSGSGETLNRGVYDFQKPFAINFSASMQMVADLGDPDKIEAVLAGGVSERHFQPHQNDQAKLWANGERRAWWFNPEQAKAHAKDRMTLAP
ncbi:MAG: penicillin acylase family protein [Burkholderiales bacterium]|nr:penicillin acylase family protein [Burkholderiales bacterium]